MQTRLFGLTTCEVHVHLLGLVQDDGERRDYYGDGYCECDVNEYTYDRDYDGCYEYCGNENDDDDGDSGYCGYH